MSEMSDTDAELVYKHLSDAARGVIEPEAYDRALKQSDRTEFLEEANDNPDSSFEWGKMYYEMMKIDRERERLKPVTCVDASEQEIDDVATDFGYTVIENIREVIREHQEDSEFAPREFVALVVGAALPESAAASQMDVSVGTFRGKKGRIQEKIDQAEKTLSVAETFGDRQ